ncbi:MAG: hypothetical protein PHH67_02795 [Methanosarcina sp.]|nr:hypothetical protein [Methanosarcina sp.]MDD4305434.1 hypothetical protein [Methanosarcina sp.]MDD4620496.1 hypothetical protein [Methanosarcina sp.]
MVDQSTVLWNDVVKNIISESLYFAHKSIANSDTPDLSNDLSNQ